MHVKKEKYIVINFANLAATLGLRPFGLSAAGGASGSAAATANGVRTVEDADLVNNANNNNNSHNNEESSAVEREIEESKRFFSRFAPPVAHHNMVQYSHLGKEDPFDNIYLGDFLIKRKKNLHRYLCGRPSFLVRSPP